MPLLILPRVTCQPVGSSRLKSDHVLSLLSTAPLVTPASARPLLSRPLWQTAPQPPLALPTCHPDPQPSRLLVLHVPQNSRAPSWHRGFAHAFLPAWNILLSFPLLPKGPTSCMSCSVECKLQEGRDGPVTLHTTAPVPRDASHRRVVQKVT